MKIFKWASWFMILTSIFHLIGHFAPPPLKNSDQEKLYSLMYNVPFELDPIFTRTAGNLYDAFSLFLSVMLFVLAFVNLTVLKYVRSKQGIKQIILLNALGMLAMLGLSITYTFSVPITLFAILFILMSLAYIKIPV